MARRRPGRPGIVKYTGGRKKTYTNLKIFNSECSVRGGVYGNACELKSVHVARNGSCVATVKSIPVVGRSRARGTWRIRWASCSVMKNHLRRRVTDPKHKLRKDAVGR